MEKFEAAKENALNCSWSGKLSAAWQVTQTWTQKFCSELALEHFQNSFEMAKISRTTGIIHLLEEIAQTAYELQEFWGFFEVFAEKTNDGRRITVLTPQSGIFDAVYRVGAALEKIEEQGEWHGMPQMASVRELLEEVSEWSRQMGSWPFAKNKYDRKMLKFQFEM